MRLPCVALALLLTACGGSASETAFPVEPVPEYARPAGEAKATATAPAEAAPAAGEPAAEQTVAPSEKQTAPSRPPSAPAGPNF
jgi:hypothetical protein